MNNNFRFLRPSPKVFLFAILMAKLVAISATMANEEHPVERKSAEVLNLTGGPLGIERVARRAAPVYESTPASNVNEVCWVQIDLGSSQLVSAVKLLPAIGEDWGRLFRLGFPLRFRIEVSDDPRFGTPLIIVDNEKEDYSSAIPTRVEIFETHSSVRGRYVRLTATKLGKDKDAFVLALYRVEVLSEGLNVALNRPISDSKQGDLGNHPLTRGPRPMGDGVVTDNPPNVTDSKQWKPLAHQAHVPTGGVVLGAGPLKTAFDHNVGYLLKTSRPDEVLKPFRDRASQSNPRGLRDEHPEWVGLLPGSSAGRFLMGAGNVLRWQDQAELQNRVNQIVSGIKSMQRTDGYLMGYPEKDILDFENGAYCRTWLTHGLIEVGITGHPEALTMLRAHYDWFNHSPYLPELLRRGGQGRQGTIGNTRLYFTSVGRPEDIQVVQRYYQENFWLQQLTQCDPRAISDYPYDKPHSYMITTLEAYLDLYRATGDELYLKAVLGGWDIYHDYFQHKGGSIAICENEYFPPKSYYIKSHTGELCGSVFWVFLNQRLHLLFPEEEKYVGEIEKTIFNVGLANQDDVGILYHARMLGKKEVGTDCNTCCEGQGTRLYGALPEFIYTLAQDGLLVDLFSPSSVRWQHDGQDFELKMETQFPFQPDVTLKISVAKPGSSKLRIRVPAWVNQPVSIAINGVATVTGKPGTYATLDRKWSNGDVVAFSLPMGFNVSRYNGTDPSFVGKPAYALEHGPILMALTGQVDESGAAELTVTSSELEACLKPVPDEPLSYAIDGDSNHKYVPYWLVKQEPFTTYPVLRDK